MGYDPNNVAGDINTVRLLISDTKGNVFSDGEIQAFLTLEGHVKLAAAQALDVIADDEALTSKVITDHDLSTDGAKLADSLRKRAATLRQQAVVEIADAEDGSTFEIVPMHQQQTYPTGGGW